MSVPAPSGAAVGDVCRPVFEDLLGHRDVPRVGLDRRQPLVHRNDRLRRVGGVAEQGDAAAPEELVGGRPVLALEPRAQCVRAVDVVEGAGIGAADVDDRDLIQVRALVDRAAAVRAASAPAGRRRRVPIAARSRCRVRRSWLLTSTNCAAVIFPASRALRPYSTPVVVPRAAGEAVARTAAEDVDHVVLERAANAVRIARRVVDVCCSPRPGNSGSGRAARRSPCCRRSSSRSSDGPSPRTCRASSRRRPAPSSSGSRSNGEAASSPRRASGPTTCPGRSRPA